MPLITPLVPLPPDTELRTMADFLHQLRRLHDQQTDPNCLRMAPVITKVILETINEQFERCFVRDGLFNIHAFARMDDREGTNLMISAMTNMRRTEKRPPHCMVILDLGNFSIRYSNLKPNTALEVLE